MVFVVKESHKLQRALQVTLLAIPAIIIMPASELDIHGNVNFEYGDVLIENRMQVIQWLRVSRMVTGKRFFQNRQLSRCY